MKLPVVFLSHGAPTLAVEDGSDTRAWAKLAQELPRPESILVVSAHWDTGEPRVSAASSPATIHDFYGFPEALYEQRYPAPGAPKLAEAVRGALEGAGMRCDVDPDRGLDHGAWVPLKWMYPGADIPATQLSVQSHRGPRHHYELGRALAGLRDQGTLILASGGIVTTCASSSGTCGSREPTAWASNFNDGSPSRRGGSWTSSSIIAASRRRQGSHPTEEHSILLRGSGAGGLPARRSSRLRPGLARNGRLRLRLRYHWPPWPPRRLTKSHRPDPTTSTSGSRSSAGRWRSSARAARFNRSPSSPMRATPHRSEARAAYDATLVTASEKARPPRRGPTSRWKPTPEEEDSGARKKIIPLVAVAVLARSAGFLGKSGNKLRRKRRAGRSASRRPRPPRRRRSWAEDILAARCAPWARAELDMSGKAAPVASRSRSSRAQW